MTAAETFIDRHGLKHAFLGNQLERAVNLVVAQGQSLLSEYGATIPPQTSSTLAFILDHPGCSMTEIADALRMPHQVIAQRLEALDKLGVITRKPDPRDGRRKVLELTTKGKKEAEILLAVLKDADEAFRALNEELGFDASAAALALIAALRDQSLSERIARRRAENAA